MAERDRNDAGRPENQRPRDRFGAPLPRGARDQLPDRVDPAAVCTSLQDGITRAVELFDAERFFEAHEFFEWVWKYPELEQADRSFFKGLAQVAVGLTHTQRGNQEGAITLLRRAANYLEGYPSPHHGIHTAAVQRLARDVRRPRGARGARPPPRLPALPAARRRRLIVLQQELLADLALEDLADLRARQVRPDDDLLGRLHAAEALLDEGDDLGLGDLPAGVQLERRP